MGSLLGDACAWLEVPVGLDAAGDHAGQPDVFQRQGHVLTRGPSLPYHLTILGDVVVGHAVNGLAVPNTGKVIGVADNIELHL